ncbi:type II toxin-antitoxin system Phd/YefM family antitoxin [Collinsella intestinalis]|uniref:type II toxin-antitoxin system Phd/YefM family antitoxin n=1 Tax=Collinsella intestinalis TaxID=147207 RepID=UPI00195DB117|nr:hypothetical protein [Collinsella intestinalis]MBM6682491.1 hypothetical protein [Collinsella intestinalis]
MGVAIEFESERYPLTEAKNRFSELTRQANATGRPFMVLKGGRPWVEVRPLRSDVREDADGISIMPEHRSVAVADLSELFERYEQRSDVYRPVEDAFASPVGEEVL